jgi:hypothetical protein
MVRQNLPYHSARMLTLEYIALVDAAKLKHAVRTALKTPNRLAGFSVEPEHLVVIDVVTGATARVVCDVPGMLRIHADSIIMNIIVKLVDRLMASKCIERKPYAAKERVDFVKPFKPARDVLAEHMSNPDFIKYILVLPEAIRGADDCKFRNDGALSRYLTNLLTFAKQVLDPENVRKPLKFLAKRTGLSHFAELISQTAQSRYREDYVATYKGRAQLVPMHVTIGAGHQETDCMSIHFLIDRESSQLVIARFGRHGRGAK